MFNQFLKNFSFITCKLAIQKKLVNNQNLNTKVIEMLFIINLKLTIYGFKELNVFEPDLKQL